MAEKKETKKVEVIEKSEAKKQVRKGFVDNCALLNIRSTPNADNGSNLIGILNAGAEIEIIDDKDKDFYQIRTVNGFEGFVMKKFITRK